MIYPEAAGEKFSRLVEIMATLRGEGGCPWDRIQDEKTILNFFLEEAYELVEAILANKTDEVAEELGDVLMEIVFLARIYEEKGAFSLEKVVDGINQKMIHRHPHVFGSIKVVRAEEVKDKWQRLKAREKATKEPLREIGRKVPALLQAFLLGRRAAHFGFDWPSAEEALKKIEEEMAELKEVLSSGNEPVLREEFGDLFFSLVNVCRLKGINPELALRQANEKFRQRFNLLWQEMKERGKEPDKFDLEEMDEIWEEIKEKEKTKREGEGENNNKG